MSYSVIVLLILSSAQSMWLQRYIALPRRLCAYSVMSGRALPSYSALCIWLHPNFGLHVYLCPWANTGRNFSDTSSKQYGIEPALVPGIVWTILIFPVLPKCHSSIYWMDWQHRFAAYVLQLSSLLLGCIQYHAYWFDGIDYGGQLRWLIYYILPLEPWQACLMQFSNKYRVNFGWNGVGYD